NDDERTLYEERVAVMVDGGVVVETAEAEAVWDTLKASTFARWAAGQRARELTRLENGPGTMRVREN
ncbi:MAG TPA: hypothetical protein VKX17_19205, partial [Planctomycetota bacterium]|nr:hypothetical protein [Planctomycetota bacterium]